MKSLSIPFALILCVSAHAGVIYDTYGSGDSYDTSTGWSVDPDQSVATPFTVTTAEYLSTIQLSLSGFANYTISLTHGGSTAPGATLATWSVVGGGTAVLTPSTPTQLLPGDYYIVAESTGPGSWYWNDIGHDGPFSFTFGGSWEPTFWTTGVMRIETVPEPASIAALATGAALLARRRRKA